MATAQDNRIQDRIQERYDLIKRLKGTLEARKSDIMHIKNYKTGEIESIKRIDINLTLEGLEFLVEDEISAYKAAYVWQPIQTRVLYHVTKQAWMVIVYTEEKRPV